MATLDIINFPASANSPGAVPDVSNGVHEIVTFTTLSVQSAVFAHPFIALKASAACAFLVGANPTAVLATSIKLGAAEYQVFKVTPGHRLAVIGS